MRILEKLSERQRAFMSHRPVIISCLGDSVTHGCFEVYINEKGNIDTYCRASEAYPALLSDELGRMFPFARPAIVNAGASGDNAANGLRRLERDCLSVKPDLVTVCFGLNDSMNPDVERGLKRYRESMRGIISGALDSGAECVVITPSFMCTYVSHRLTDKKLRDIAFEAMNVQNGGVLAEYAETAKEVALEMNASVADAYSQWKKLASVGVDTTEMLSNSINHPTREAHRIFVSEIMKALAD